MEPLAHLVEQHDGNSFRRLANGKCRDGGHRHEELLVKQLTASDALGGTDEDGQANQQVGDEEDCVLDPGNVHDAKGVGKVDHKPCHVDAGGHHDELEGDLPSATLVMAVAVPVIMHVIMTMVLPVVMIVPMAMTVIILAYRRVAHDSSFRQNIRTLKHSNELLIFVK